MESFKLSSEPSPEAPKETLADVFKKHPIPTTVLVLIILGTFGSMFGGGANNVTSDVQTPTVAMEQKDIVVTSQTVKQVDGKYRYFFDIRNNDTVPFEGNVRIELLQDKGNTIGQGDFAASQPIQAGMGDSVYIDINTGPEPYFEREFAVTAFRYSVTENNQIVAGGTWEIIVP